LLHRFYTAEYPRPRIAGFSRLVDEAALAGDTVARDLLMGAAQQLAALTAAVRRQLFATAAKCSIAFIGGVFRSGLLLERYRLLVEMEEGNTVAPPRYGPAAGALIEAYRAAGMRPVISNVPEAEK
jgi:N-acetylglucosamine kinase-like BadF-type ATPase